MKLSITSSSPEETRDLGEALGQLAKPGDVFLLSGELGSGKTQFTKGIAIALGIERPVTSPTFNLVYEYQGAQVNRVTLRHFDLYRLEHEEQLDDIDYFGLLEDEAISVVEWGDKFLEALPMDYLLIDFEFRDENTRVLRFSAEGSRSEKLLRMLKGLSGAN